MADYAETRKDELRIEKEVLMDKIRLCEYKIDQISERNEMALQADSDDDIGVCEDLSSFDRRKLDNRIDIDSLKLSLKATEEVSSLAIHNYSIDVLTGVPDDMKDCQSKNYSKYDILKRVDMTCSIDWIPFRLSYVVREPIKDRKRRSYHNIQFVIDRPQPALELSTVGLTTDRGPVALVNQLRQYVNLCRRRMEALHKLKDLEGKLFELKKAEDGGYLVAGSLFNLRWFVKLKSGKLTFDYDLETDDNYEEFPEAARALVAEMSEGEQAEADLLEALIKYSYREYCKANDS